ncbi:MAG TPA: PEGA domain-containing protein [Pseudomonadales bacterium]
MSTRNGQDNNASQVQADDLEIIEAVSYTPREQAPKRKLPLTPFQIGAVLVAIPVMAIMWFLFTAKSVRLEFDPPAASESVSEGPAIALGDIYLMLDGEYRVSARAEGYEPLDELLVVGDARSQTHRFEFTKLPGRVTFLSNPDGAEVIVAGALLGRTPLDGVKVPAGPATISMKLDRYQRLDMEAEIEGLDRAQTVEGSLLPDWAEVSVSSIPAGAEILLNDQPTGRLTPAVIEVPTGEHEIRLKAPGHRGHRQRILVAALDEVTLPEVTLLRADGLLQVTSRPAGAGVTLNGQFQGETPVEIAVKSGISYRVKIFKAGFAPGERSVRVASGGERTVDLTLTRLTGQLIVTTQPAEAELFVDGRNLGNANQTLTLPTVTHRVEIALDGYAGYSTEITPRNGVTQEIKVRLLTLEEARLAAMKPIIQTSQGQELVLLNPGPFTMGASRREPGRRANETLREVGMERIFYLSRTEVTNAQFLDFAPGHDSGEFQDHELNKDDQPVVGVSWQEAALYCNWLSAREGLPPFYATDLGKVVATNPAATGYRLPTEAEWEWAARQNGPDSTGYRFPWGTALPPPDRHGNYADRSAAHLVGRVVFGYNDNHIVSAETGTFAPNAIGIYDLAGNVAEWVNDFYEIPGAEPTKDPLGPDTGEYRVIRGSSWMNGTITDLRLSFRDYGVDGREDVGFRIARFAEPS